MPRTIEELIAKAETESIRIEMKMLGDPRGLALIRRLVAASTMTLKVSADTLNDLKLAITEACTNVIKHAFKFDSSRTFGIHMRASPILFQISVQYDDAKFDPTRIREPNLEEVQDSGFGVFIIRQIMDDVRYTTDPTSGAVELRMIKILDQAYADGGGHRETAD